MAKTRIKNRQRDESARVVAGIVGVSESLVHKVRTGNRENDEVVANLIDYKNQKEQLIENLKKKQALYFEAYKKGLPAEEISELEEEIDILQAEFQLKYAAKLDQFAAKICA